MRFNKLILYIAFPFILGGCNDWLSVSPENNINEKELFAKEAGYQVALNGVYKTMAETSLYGQEMIYGAIEVLGHSYDSYAIYEPYSDLYDNNYTDSKVKDIFEAIWSKTYTAIANCNNLIENIKNEDLSNFADGEMGKNLILGEAYALRGFLHFDILRLFAPSKRADDGKNYIPYYERYKSTYEPHATVDQVLEKIKTDLLKAKDLVAPFDTLQEHKNWLQDQYRFDGGKMGGASNEKYTDNLFYAYRGYRMNYYAIVATLARVYSWSDNLKEAYDAALEVIKQDQYFDFVSAASFPEDHKLREELIFGLSNQKLVENYLTFLPQGSVDITGPGTFYVDYDQVEWDPWDENEDARFLTFLSKRSYYYYSLKYTSQTGSKLGEDLIPMIRISEMYYIASEYLYKNNQPDEAFKMIDKVRNARGILNAPIKDNIYDEESFEEELTKEVHKDLMAEGQAFYWYKKFDLKFSRRTIFVIPTPDNENIN